MGAHVMTDSKSVGDLEQAQIDVNNGSSMETKAPIQEASEIYGNVHVAETLGYVHRGLKARHIQFIGLGGSIGTGLFLGIGKALTTSGPLSLFLGYAITGIGVYGVMQCLGEMSTWLPLPGAVPYYAARYVDDALGFAIGWTSWYNCAITLAVEISAAAVLIEYWNETINVAAWISIFIVLLFCLNIFAISIYGEAEFWFASVKIASIIGLLLLAVIIDLGGGPNKDRIGFRYWRDPGAMNTFLTDGDLGRFWGFLYTFENAAFSYGGIEGIVVAAGEAEDPRRNMPKAIRRLFWRILFFYVLGALAVGVLVPYNDDKLLKAVADGAPGSAQSPWVIAISAAGIDVLPSIINAVILTSALSSANAYLYSASRYMFSLAQIGQAPRFLLRCSKSGIPYYCVGITGSVAFLTYLSCGSSGPASVFNWLGNIATLGALLAWVTICYSYIRFYNALKAQGIDRNELVFKSPWQPYLSWVCFTSFIIVILINGFYTLDPFDVQNFITSYIGIPLFAALYIFWKIFKKTRLIPSSEVDLHTGKAAIDAITWPRSMPRNIWEKIWQFIV